MLQDIGVTVLRQVPKHVLLGLASGAYSLHGGVVREFGGRIVAHLIQPGVASTVSGVVPGIGWIADAFQSYELWRMGLTLGRVQSQVSTVLKLATATTAISGLGVAVGIASYVALSRQVSAIGEAVRRVEAQTKRTNQFLDATHYGELQAALDDLRHAKDATSERTITDCLQSAKGQFAKIFHRAQSLWPQVESIADASALEESANVAMTGQALAMSELGEHEMALADFALHRSQWRELARTWCRQRVLREDPQRLLAPELRGAIPARELVRLMDFADLDGADSPRGIDWIDDLRDRQSKASRLKLPSFADETPALTFAQRLVARDDLLGATESHLGELARYGMSVRQFEALISKPSIAEGDTSPLWVVDRQMLDSATQPVAT
ncbi:MAG: hypothetical protein ABIR54_01015 [Burkholderiaceae bacterium]